MTTNHNILSCLLVVLMAACSANSGLAPEQPVGSDNAGNNTGDNGNSAISPVRQTVSEQITTYTDQYGDVAYIPGEFAVSVKADEQTVRTGLVVIGPDGSEYVWIPTANTPLEMRDFGSYYSGNSLSGYHDETDLPLYKDMVKSVEYYGGFYIGRYEASNGGGSSLSDYMPLSKPVTKNQPGSIWVRFSPQNATVACQNIYRDNATVQGFFPWGANWDTMLQWLIDSGNKTKSDVASNSTSWGNYSNDSFSPGAVGNYTGAYEDAKSNNIYDLAGNNWEWTQERYGSTNYVMRGGGYNIMGGACNGDVYPAAIRDPLPGNSNHPNVCFRTAFFLVIPGTSTNVDYVRI